MKHILSLAAAMLLLVPAVSAHAGNNCQRKEQALERQLEIARQHNNRNRVAGLETALGNVRTWCSDGGLVKKAEGKVEDKREKVKEREEELAEAVAENKGADKKAKRERKLEEAKAELREAEKERDALLDSIKVDGE